MRYLIANDVINRAAVEVGLPAVNDPVGSNDETSIQLLQLLNSAGLELLNLHDWPQLRSVIDFTTSSGDSGEYPLPVDFDRMIDQTGWDRTNRMAIGGPLSAQDWTYLEGRDLSSQSIYASFRLMDNALFIYPQPPPDGLRITFEYISRNWIQENGAPQRNREDIGAGSDIIWYEPLLIIKMLKLKWLQSKGMPAQDAAMEFDTMLQSRIGKSTGAPVLSAGKNARGFPYLSPYKNTGDTGFGG